MPLPYLLEYLAGGILPWMILLRLQLRLSNEWLDPMPSHATAK
jgi:hypothetical protein